MPVMENYSPKNDLWPPGRDVRIAAPFIIVLPSAAECCCSCCC